MEPAIELLRGLQDVIRERPRLPSSVEELLQRQRHGELAPFVQETDEVDGEVFADAFQQLEILELQDRGSSDAAPKLSEDLLRALTVVELSRHGAGRTRVRDDYERDEDGVRLRLPSETESPFD